MVHVVRYRELASVRNMRGFGEMSTDVLNQTDRNAAMQRARMERQQREVAYAHCNDHHSPTKTVMDCRQSAKENLPRNCCNGLFAAGWPGWRRYVCQLTATPRAAVANFHTFRPVKPERLLMNLSSR